VKSPERTLAWLLRAVGALDLLSLLAVVMPRSWHDWAHQGAGLGPLPDGAIVFYLTRSASALYALYGALLLFLSRDVVRHLPVIRFLAVAAQVHAVVLMAIDVAAGLPRWWVLAEGLGYSAWSLAVLWLVRRVANPSPS